MKQVYRVGGWHRGAQIPPQNGLYTDRKGKFFLAQAGDIEDPRKLPDAAFIEVSFPEAVKWVIYAQENYADSYGTTKELLKYAVKLIGGAK